MTEQIMISFEEKRNKTITCPITLDCFVIFLEEFILILLNANRSVSQKAYEISRRFISTAQ